MKETDEAKLCLTCRPGAYYRADVPLYLLMVYAKARRDDLAPVRSEQCARSPRGSNRRSGGRREGP
jgi:hypothetical protein